MRPLEAVVGKAEGLVAMVPKTDIQISKRPGLSCRETTKFLSRTKPPNAPSMEKLRGKGAIVLDVQGGSVKDLSCYCWTGRNSRDEQCTVVHRDSIVSSFKEAEELPLAGEKRV